MADLILERVRGKKEKLKTPDEDILAMGLRRNKQILEFLFNIPIAERMKGKNYIDFIVKIFDYGKIFVDPLISFT